MSRRENIRNKREGDVGTDNRDETCRDSGRKRAIGIRERHSGRNRVGKRGHGKGRQMRRNERGERVEEK
jgi:hypothetical protein